MNTFATFTFSDISEFAGAMAWLLNFNVMASVYFSKMEITIFAKERGAVKHLSAHYQLTPKFD